uniref:Gfo/Idh/MocA family protein n=1 Tax=uncultured Draconibacterium sp. TaxID=1573823 RepID=UPI0032172E7E
MKRRLFFKNISTAIPASVFMPVVVPSSILGNSIQNNDITNIAADTSTPKNVSAPNGLRIGMIGLDTSHCIAFTKAFNAPNADNDFGGFKVIAAWPTTGSHDIPASIDRLAGFTEQVKQQGVEIVNSIEELIETVDVILLETIDGRKHLEYALPVIKAGKRMFIDKPMTASLSDAMIIFKAAKHYNTPVFSSSSLRYISGMNKVRNGTFGKVNGAITYSPAIIEKSHPDLFWYGIHGVEILFAAMGEGCKMVSRISTNDTDVVSGVWEDNRIGTFHGMRTEKKGYGGTVFCEKEIKSLGPYIGYNSLLKEIVDFFKTGIVPVAPEETLDILSFMVAADESKKRGGIPVSVNDILEQASNKIKDWKY